MKSIQHIDINIPNSLSLDDLHPHFHDLITKIRPELANYKITLKVHKGGISNRLYGCILRRESTQPFQHNPHVDLSCECGSGSFNSPCDDSPSPDDSESEQILVRVFGNGTEHFIDRDSECKAMQLLHTFGLGACVYAVLKNGMAYEYLPGSVFSYEMVIDKSLSQMIAERLAEIHIRATPAFMDSTTPSSPTFCAKESILEHKLHLFLRAIPERFTDPSKQRRFEQLSSDGTLPPTREALCELVERSLAHWRSLDAELGFTHNDLLLHNLIIHPSRRSVSFIDFEYAGWNYLAFDIADHFVEFAGLELPLQHSRYPPEGFRREWLTHYLLKRRELLLACARAADDEREASGANDTVGSVTALDSEPFDEQLERLLRHVQQFSVAAHLFWAMWGFMQAEHSIIDFDYFSYAVDKYCEFKRTWHTRIERQEK